MVWVLAWIVIWIVPVPGLPSWSIAKVPWLHEELTRRAVAWNADASYWLIL